MKRIIEISLIYLAVIFLMVMTSCSNKELTIKGDRSVEGELSSYLTLSTDSLYLVTFEKDANGLLATTTLQLEADSIGDFKEVNLTAAILDSDDDPLCEFLIKSDYGKDKLMDVMRSGRGHAKVKFASNPLTAKEVENVMEKGTSIRIIASERTYNKTPEQLQAEQDSIAQANISPMEIEDFLGPKKTADSGFYGKVRDLRSTNQIISSLEAKGFTLDKKYSRNIYEDYLGESVNYVFANLSRKVGAMTETVSIDESQGNIIINFCNNDATTAFMAKMTTDGYRNGVSSNCYYAGSEIKRSDNKVTLRQIWEP